MTHPDRKYTVGRSPTCDIVLADGKLLVTLLLLRWGYRIIKTVFSLLFQRRSSPL